MLIFFRLIINSRQRGFFFMFMNFNFLLNVMKYATSMNTCSSGSSDQGICAEGGEFKPKLP